jgi:2',3'-cyclic-nucleotide 2'-phosphodiesterase (5'-nucleotidase family)
VARLGYEIQHDPDYDPTTSLILCAGDTFQGGYIAHEEKTISNELLSDIGVQAMALGNHEFDWGIDTLTTLCKASPFPMLSANLINATTDSQASFVTPSCVIDKGNVRYGVIGAIGSGETSSIAAGMLGDYTFSPAVRYVTDEVAKLKAQNCDLIVLLVHDDIASNYTVSLGNALSVSDGVSGIFGGHSHQFQAGTSGNLPYVQGGSNSKGYCKMKFSLMTKGVLKKQAVSDTSVGFDAPEADLNQDVVSRLAAADKEYNVHDLVATMNGDFYAYGELHKLIPEAMTAVCQSYGSVTAGRPVVAIHNNAGIRSDIASGPLDRAHLFKVSPFDNLIKVARNISGSAIRGLIGSDSDGKTNSTAFYAYSVSDDTAIRSSTTYDVVTIDFVSTSSYWNNVSELRKAVQYEGGSNNQPLLIRDALTTYMMGKTFDASAYSIAA